MGIALAHVVGRTNAYRIFLIWILERMRPLGRSGHGWENSTGMHLK